MDKKQYYEDKYLKYKLKYLTLKNQLEGGGSFLSGIASKHTGSKHIFYVDGMEAHLRSRKLYGNRNDEFNKIIFQNKIIKKIKDESSKQENIAAAIDVISNKENLEQELKDYLKNEIILYCNTKYNLSLKL
jgi:hypothetical protein